MIMAEMKDESAKKMAFFIEMPRIHAAGPRFGSADQMNWGIPSVTVSVLMSMQ